MQIRLVRLCGALTLLLGTACGNKDATGGGDREDATPALDAARTHEGGIGHMDSTSSTGGAGALLDAAAIDGMAMTDGTAVVPDGPSQDDAPSRTCLVDGTYDSATLGDQAAIAACGSAGMQNICAADGGAADGGAADGGAADGGVEPRDPDLLTGAASLDGSEEPLTDYFVLELYKGYSSFGTEIAPGTYPIAGDELDYSTCGVCPMIRADCSYDGVCRQTFYATGGTVIITSVSPNLAFTVENLTFMEATLDPAMRVSTPVPGGCVSAIASGSFDAFVFTM